MALNKFETVDVTPDISLLKKMASISGSIPSRIMELVDNCIDAKIVGKPLEIHVKITKKGQNYSLLVEDNGSGMDEVASRSFFRLGDSQKHGKKIGKFGIGSKVAILGLGDTCKIQTSPVDQPYNIEIDFDIRQFKTWDIQYKMKPDVAEHHGTKIKIDNLTVRIGEIDRFCDRLHEQFAKVYKHFIDTGEVKIYINGSKVVPKSFELIPGLYQSFDFEIAGKRVTGWAGATKEAGTNWKFGFDLIQNGRIIKANDFLFRQAHTSLARLVGEVHLDNFATDVHKTDFIRFTPDFHEMQEYLMNHVLAELLTKISKLTNQEVFKKYHVEMDVVSKTLNKVLRSYDFLKHLDLEDGVLEYIKKKARRERMPKYKNLDEVSGEDKDEKMQEFHVEVEEEIEVEVEVESDADHMDGEVDDGIAKAKKEPKHDPSVGFIIDEPIPIGLGENQPLKRWSIFDSTQGIHLAVEINMDHPTYQNESEVSVLVRNAVIDSVAEFIITEEKKQTVLADEVERLNSIKDMIIRYSVKMTS
jgi:hypothetical protein